MSDNDRPVRVLVLDPSPESRKKTAQHLESEGFEAGGIAPEDAVGTVEDGSELDYDCVVTEFDLGDACPEATDLLRRLRHDEPRLPFVFYTSVDGVSSELVGREFVEYVPKSRASPSQEGLDLLVERVKNVVEHRETVEDEAERLRILSVIREINRAITRASRRAELEERVCEIISESDPYVFAWFGRYDSETQEVVPTAYAGIEEGYLDEIEISLDGKEGEGPTGRTVRSHEVEVMQNIPEDPKYEPWRDQALERGYESSVSVPAVFDGCLYGTLNVYSDRRFAFDDDEKELLGEIGEDIGFGLDAIERRHELERSVGLLSIAETTAEIGGWEYIISTGSDEEAEPKIRWTEGARRICGSEDETIEFEEAIGFIHPDHREAITEPIESVSEFDATVRTSEATCGSVPDDGWVRVIGEEVNDCSDVVMRGSIQDVTRMKRRERRLEIYRKVINSSEDMIAAVDSDYEYVLANREYADFHAGSGTSPSDIEGMYLRDEWKPRLCIGYCKAGFQPESRRKGP